MQKHMDVRLLKSKTGVIDFLHNWRFFLSNLTSFLVKRYDTDVKYM